MNDFDYDVMQKKNIARNAKYRKCGSKSHKCTLSHENLSKKELEAMNGPVVTYNLTKPMTYAQYRKLPKRVQDEYLGNLVRNFGIGCTKLAEMFKCCPETARKCMHNAGIRLEHRHDMTNRQVVMWEGFLGRALEAEEPAEATVEAPVETPVEAPTEAPTEAPQLWKPAHNRKTTPALKSAELTLHGSAEQIANEILHFLAQFDADMNCAVQLKFDA